LGANREALQRYSLAVLSHLLLVAAWHFFRRVGKVPKFVMPSPLETLNALLVPNYRWLENIASPASEIFGGYFSPSSSASASRSVLLVPLARAGDHAAAGQPQHDPEGRARPLIIVWFKYGIGPNIMMAFAICFFPIVLTTARGLRRSSPICSISCAR
jgi:NitT/TauT family transport system permease protein